LPPIPAENQTEELSHIYIHPISLGSPMATLNTLSLGVKSAPWCSATPTAPKIINGRNGSGPIKFIANSFVPAKLFLIVLGN